MISVWVFVEVAAFCIVVELCIPESGLEVTAGDGVCLCVCVCARLEWSGVINKVLSRDVQIRLFWPWHGFKLFNNHWRKIFTEYSLVHNQLNFVHNVTHAWDPVSSIDGGCEHFIFLFSMRLASPELPALYDLLYESHITDGHAALRLFDQDGNQCAVRPSSVFGQTSALQMYVKPVALTSLTFFYCS